MGLRIASTGFCVLWPVSETMCVIGHTDDCFLSPDQWSVAPLRTAY